MVIAVVPRGVADNDGPGRPLPCPLACVSGGRGQGAPGAVKEDSPKTAIGMGGGGGMGEKMGLQTTNVNRCRH